MLTIKHDLRSDPLCKDGVTIRHLADLHIGSPNCDLDYVKQLVDENVNNHWYCFLGGDLLDVGLKTSKSDVYTQTMTIDEAMDVCCEILEPLASNNLILGAVQGNHENRLTKEAGVDITKNILARLDLTHVYNPNAVLAFLQVGSQGGCVRQSNAGKSNYKWAHCYAVHLTHGHAGGSTFGGRANALTRASNKIDCDVYLQGHTHHSDVILGSFLRVNRQQISVRQVEKVFVCCGSCLSYDDSYAEGMNLSPSDNRYPRVFLHGDKQLAEATV